MRRRLLPALCGVLIATALVAQPAMADPTARSTSRPPSSPADPSVDPSPSDTPTASSTPAAPGRS
ncbi:hypothetical protein, partial [Nonomuraea dietziae]